MNLVLLLAWSLLPILAIWIGLYQLNNALWAFALYHGGCLLPVIIYKRSTWLPSIKKPTLLATALIILASIGCSLLIHFAYEHFGKHLLSDESVIALLHRQGLNKSLFIPMSFYFVVINPTVEEIYWRGILLNELEAAAPHFRRLGIIWSSCAYAMFHYLIFRLVLFPGWAELGIFMLAIYGGILALVYRRTGSIITTSMAHGLLTDAAVIVLIIDLWRRYPGALN